MNKLKKKQINLEELNVLLIQICDNSNDNVFIFIFLSQIAIFLIKKKKKNNICI